MINVQAGRFDLTERMFQDAVIEAALEGVDTCVVTNVVASQWRVDRESEVPSLRTSCSSSGAHTDLASQHAMMMRSHSCDEINGGPCDAHSALDSNAARSRLFCVKSLPTWPSLSQIPRR